MMQRKRIVWPIGAFLAGSSFMTAIYFGIVSLAEGFDHAVEFFLEDLWLIMPLIVGFGIQSALYIALKKQLFVPITNMGASGTMTGAGGTTSTLGMVACCAHHVTDVLPILGLSAAATFLAEYQEVFMFIGLGTTIIGILVMIGILIRERNKALGIMVESKPIISRINKKSLVIVGSLVSIIGIGFGIANFLPVKPDNPSLSQEADLEPVNDSNPDESYPIVLEAVSSDERLWFSGETKLDDQGAVVVEITPLHLNMRNNTLYFGVALNTHSVDLSMDLAKLASMVIDFNEEIEAEFWDGPSGGHHVSGTLIFSLTESEMAELLKSNDLELTLFNVDAAERIFYWTKNN
jgi:hypothetical protein